MGFDFLDFGFPKSGTDWKSINGKPEIVVSSKGRSNQLSNKINDGADFGPDTTLNATSPSQTGPPYTQTYGIQEAINYAFSKGIIFTGSGGTSLIIPEIKLNGEVYQINAPITIPAASTGIAGPNFKMSGEGIQNTILLFNLNNEWGITISPNNSYGMFVFESFSPNSGVGFTPNGWLNADWSDSSYAGQTNAVLRDINIYPANWAINSMVFKDMAVVMLINVWDTTSATDKGPVLACKLNQWLGGVSYQPINLTNTPIGVFVVELDGLQSCPINVTFGTALLSVRNCMGFVITLGAITMFNLYLENVHYGSLSSSALLSASSATTIEMLTIRGLYTDVTQTKSLIDSTYLTVNEIDAKGIYTSGGSLTLPAVSTPAVPASGTAQANTNQYPVNVYVNGGTVTEVQITKNGTANTVFSNATGLALAGQNFKLEVGDSITITYTAAPSWVWLKSD